MRENTGRPNTTPTFIDAQTNRAYPSAKLDAEFIRLLTVQTLIGWITTESGTNFYIKAAPGHSLYLSCGADQMIFSAGNSLKYINTSGNFDMNSKKIINLTTPAADADAATKKYVDDNVVGAIGCRVYNDAAISIPDDTETALTFNSERFDNASMHSTSSNTSRLIAVKAGVYIITGTIQWASGAACFKDIGLKVGGSNLIAYGRAYQSGNKDQQTIATIWKFAVNEYVELIVYQNSGGAVNVEHVDSNTPEFGMVYVGPGT